MSPKALSSLDLRVFFRFFHNALGDSISIDTWTSFQKMLLTQSQPQLANFVKEFKKFSPAMALNFRDGFSAGQIESKLWLFQVLQDVLPPGGKLNFFVLGSWFGLLPRLIIWLLPERVQKVWGIDLDKDCYQPSRLLNQPEVWEGQVHFFTQDMIDYPYQQIDKSNSILINTSCEHLAEFDRWYAKVPAGMLLVLQGNDFADHDEHVTSWKNFSNFSQSCPMQTVLYEGELKLPMYKRFMKIGVK